MAPLDTVTYIGVQSRVGGCAVRAWRARRGADARAQGESGLDMDTRHFKVVIRFSDGHSWHVLESSNRMVASRRALRLQAITFGTLSPARPLSVLP